LVFRAAGSGVLLVVVLVALAEALVVAELLAEAVLVALVRPADGASWTPAAFVPPPLLLLPQPAMAAASASAAPGVGVGFLMWRPRVARAPKKRRRTALLANGVLTTRSAPARRRRRRSWRAPRPRRLTPRACRSAS